MTTRSTTTLAALVLLLGLGAPGQGAEMSREQILAEATTLAKDRFEQMKHDFRHRSWIHGTFWAGVVDLSKVSDDPALDEAIKKLARSRGVRNVGVGTLERHDKSDPLHADDMGIGQAFLDYALEHDDDEVSAKTIQRVEEVTAFILSDQAAQDFARFDELGTHGSLTWSWIDALFMAAPLHARLTQETGDPRYLEAMFLEWHRVYDRLYDQDQHLYYRDKAYLTKRSRSGQPVFWSRGNGWVMGAFAHTLPYIPEDHSERAWLVTQFQEMSAKLASIQHADGTWSPSLIDFDHFPYSEMSATAFFCFGMAYGINQGILDDATYRPVVAKAWAAMLAAKNDEGFMGYVQGVGAEPAGVGPQYATLYGDGAFLMAAVQLAELAPLTVPAAPELSPKR